MTLKVVSLNIWVGELWPAPLDWLKQQNADILLLQEVTNSQDKSLPAKYRLLDELRRGLDYEYDDFVHSFVYREAVGAIPQGSAIFSRFPIKAQPARFFIVPKLAYYENRPEHWNKVPRTLQHIELDTPAGRANVFNIQGIWDLNGDDYSPARQRMTDTVLDAIKGKPNVIFGGDSNASQGNPLWQRVEKHLKTAFPNGLNSTFNMRRKSNPGYATAAVDVVYVSPNIKVLSAECPDVDISDHLPLVVTLDIA
jgi:endonuclease/exonuclease/phosphatase family metal-dependent hydrolase